MSEVLAPRLELFRRPASLFPQPRQSLSYAVRIEVEQAGFLEGLPEDVADRRRIAPVFLLRPTTSKRWFSFEATSVAENSRSSPLQSLSRNR